VVSIPACHAGDPGSIPGLRAFFNSCCLLLWFCLLELLLFTRGQPSIADLSAEIVRCPLRTIEVKRKVLKPLNENETQDKIFGFQNSAQVFPTRAEAIMEFNYIFIFVLTRISSVLNFSISLQVD
jgi:hypothetical protein